MSFSSRSNSSLLQNSGGFTLLEVIIVMAIMVFIALGIYQATTESFKLRDVLTIEGEFYNEIRLSMNILQKDVSMVYSPTLMSPDDQNKAQNAPQAGVPVSQQAFKEQQAIEGSDLGLQTDFWLPATDLLGIRPSRFVGSETKMSFIAASHQRIYKDSNESDFAKITYEVKRDELSKWDDPKDSDRLRDTSILVKSENADAFELDDSKAKNSPTLHSYTILHGIKKIKFQYCKFDSGPVPTCLGAWDNATPDLKGKYPDIIRLNVEVWGPKNLTFEGIYQMKPELPLRGLDPSS